MATAISTIDLTSVSSSDLARELVSRGRQSHALRQILSPCRFCTLPFGVRAMRHHLHVCTKRTPETRKALRQSVGLRRSPEEMNDLRTAIIEAVAAQHPTSVLELFTRLVNDDVLPDNQSAYRCLRAYLFKLKTAGVVPPEHIVLKRPARRKKKEVVTQ